MTDAFEYGFSPEASGIENRKALQAAVDQGGTVIISRQGVYRLAGTVYVGSHTTITFCNHTCIEKTAEAGEYSHVFLNKGALTKTWDEGIRIENLVLRVNHVDIRKFLVEGLHGQLAFFYVRDLAITGFRCMDLGKWQYGIQICTFENIVVKDLIIKGDKDGVHLGRGKRFLISECTFDTYDDAVALNGHDYDVGNPELGWIEDGVVEKCQDLSQDGASSDGYFCRILAGGWVDWYSGIHLQKSDTVVANGRLYRVKADPDGREYCSTICPDHEKGQKIIEGICWVMVQDEVTYTAGVRNVTFRDITLQKPRTGFSIHFDCDRYSRSYYPGAEVPFQRQILLDGVKVTHDLEVNLLEVETPVDAVSILHSTLPNNRIVFQENKAMKKYGDTSVLISGCILQRIPEGEIIENRVEGKNIREVFFGNMQMN